MAYYIDKNIIKYKAFDDSWKVTEVMDYRGHRLYKFIIGDYSEDGLLTNKAIILECVKWLAPQINGVNSFSRFEEKFAGRLSHYNKSDKSYYLECYYLVLKEKNKTKENEIKRVNRKMTNKDKEMCLQMMFGSFVSFFLLGIIAYALKHLLFAAWSLITFIGYCLINAAYAFLGIIFNFDTGSGIDWSTDIIGTPLGVWKAGGFIYGAIVLIIFFGCLNELIKDKCSKNKQSKL